METCFYDLHKLSKCTHILEIFFFLESKVAKHLWAWILLCLSSAEKDLFFPPGQFLNSWNAKLSREENGLLWYKQTDSSSWKSGQVNTFHMFPAPVLQIDYFEKLSKPIFILQEMFGAIRQQRCWKEQSWNSFW